MNGIKTALADYIATSILPGSEANEILNSSSLFDDGFVDSLGLQQILLYIENTYTVEVGEDDLVPENFETVAGIAALVDKLQAA